MRPYVTRSTAVSEVRIAAESRTEFGKGAARRIRRDHKVPGVIYGHGTAPRHVSLPGHDLMLALKTPNVLLALDVDGEPVLVLPKDVQRDPVKGFIEHVDLVVVERGEAVSVELPIHVTGKPAGDGLLVVDLQTVSVVAEATHLPEFVELSIDGMPAGTQVLAKEISLPAGATLEGDPELSILRITGTPTAEQLDADLAGAEAELGIVHEAKTDAAPAGAEG
nr:50S ribosomal protein L25/general stress protein Ctc [Motilibacter aurantiacus]